MSNQHEPSAKKKERSAWWVKTRAELPGKIKHWLRKNFGMERKAAWVLLKRGLTLQTKTSLFLLVLCAALARSGNLRDAFGMGLVVLISLAVLNLAVAFLCKVGRIRAFAARYIDATRTPGYALMNGIGTGFGCAAVLCVFGAVRELIGSGTLAGVSLFGEALLPALLVALPCGGLLLLGFLLALLQWLGTRSKKGAAQ